MLNFLKHVNSQLWCPWAWTNLTKSFSEAVKTKQLPEGEKWRIGDGAQASFVAESDKI